MSFGNTPANVAKANAKADKVSIVVFWYHFALGERDGARGKTFDDPIKATKFYNKLKTIEDNDGFFSQGLVKFVTML